MTSNRLLILREESFSAAIARLASDLDEYKTTSQLQGGTGGLIGMLTENDTEFDYQADFKDDKTYSHKIEMTFTSKMQKMPILNPYINVYVNDYLVSSTDVMTNFDQGINALLTLRDDTDFDQDFVQKYIVEFSRHPGHGNYTLKVKAGAYGSESCDLNVTVTTTTW